MVHINGRREGFSLLEVLVAIVVLTVGLLALAALQGSLTRASADAKVRARVASMLTARMDWLRQQGYGGMGEGTGATLSSIDNPNDPTTGCDPTLPGGDWMDCARAQAGIGQLNTRQTITVWYGPSTFATGSDPSARDPRVAQFKRITLDAWWSDAGGVRHDAQLVSDVSAMTLTSNIVIPPDPLGSGGGSPIVRTSNPATAGVIPIALSTESTSATTNPSPELVGSRNNQQIVGTRYSVLNYTPPGFGNSVVIQKRFDNEVVKCSCRYGAGGSNLPEIYRTSLWPAVWTGEGYAVATPDSGQAAPGQALSSGPRSGVTQSDLCQECCRDHHDTGTSGEVRFDPERSDNSVTKYDLNNQGTLVAVNNTNNGTYVDSCRLVRVDGFWRTASDLYARQYGLLETQAVSSVAAKSGLPKPEAVTHYTTFVKDFLADYDGTSGTPPSNAQSTFIGDTAFDAATITIPAVSNTDYRYLHARGLYVDHLEQAARDKLSEVLADDGEDGLCPSGTPAEECVMPYLPFTTANLTEIAKWTASNDVLVVNSSNLLSTDPALPSGGRTIGASNGSANNVSTMRLSNSGVAVNGAMTTLAGVDPTDDNDIFSDTQAFQVGGVAAPTFDVRVSGGGGNPFVFFTLGTDTNKECLKPSGTDHRCTTSPGTSMPLPGSLVLSNYWLETTTNRSITAVCSGRTVTDTIAVPTFRNYVLSTATLGGVNGTILPPVNDNKISESTSVAFGAIAQGALILVGFTEQTGSPTYATVATCSTNGGGNKILNPTWNKPWTQP